jgi:hypothetical protein
MVIPHFNADKNYTFAYRAVNYFLNLDVPKNLPNGIEIMNPYTSNIVKDVVEKFYNKFFNDDNKRIFILGINPGRFGGGVTGISFTDPLALVKYCGIENEFIKKAELSSNFVYTFISRLGSVEKFYSKYFISALFPLALVKIGTN